MGYTAHLARLLAPLGIYDLRETSLSGACIAALGEAMDEVAEELAEGLREALLPTAQDTGLHAWEQTLGLPAQATGEARRAALKSLLCADPVWCSPLQLQQQLQACGISVTLTVADQTVRVRCSTIPVEGGWERHLIEALLPAHLTVEYRT